MEKNVTYRTEKNRVPNPGSRVEWFSTFCDFWKATRFCWSGIFLGGQFQKNRRNSQHAQQNSHFQKIAGTLKLHIFYANLQNLSLYITEQSPKKQNLKLKFVKYLFLFSKNGQNGFWTESISSVFTFKQAKEHILFQVKP